MSVGNFRPENQFSTRLSLSRNRAKSSSPKPQASQFNAAAVSSAVSHPPRTPDAEACLEWPPLRGKRMGAP